jgi:phage-related protein
MEIKFYNREIEDFICSLEKATIAKILHSFDLLGEFGNYLGMPHSKKLCRGLFELRVRGKQEIRFIYTFGKKFIIVLTGFIKKSQHIPKHWLDLSEKRLKSIDLI